MTDPDYQDEVLCRVAHARSKKRRAVRRALMWRNLSRAQGRSPLMSEMCEGQFAMAWEDVRYWVHSELYARGR